MYILYNVYMYYLILLVIGYIVDKGFVSNVSYYIYVYMIFGFNYGYNEYWLFKIVYVFVIIKICILLCIIYK